MLSFPRNLNLLIEDDLSIFFQEVTRSSYQLPVTTENELKKLIQFGGEFFPNPVFEITAGVTPLEEKLIDMIRAGQADKFINNILSIIFFLYNFKDDNGFINRVKANLANPPQFNDTFLELNCLNIFHRNGFFFQYEPAIFVGNKQKNPDFRLTKDDIELFCECKQVRIGQNKAELKFDEQHAYAETKFLKIVQRQLFDSKLRLEVNFKSSPSSVDLDELAKQVNQLSSDPRGIRELPLQQVGISIEYLVILQSEPSPFTMRSLRTITFAQVRIGEPFKIGDILNSPGGEISFVSTDLARRKANTLGRNIREARNQLPDDKPGIIILNQINLKIADQVIKRRVNQKRYDNIITFVVNPFHDFWQCHRIGSRELLFDLFDGFLPDNPFKLK